MTTEELKQAKRNIGILFILVVSIIILIASIVQGIGQVFPKH